MAEPQMLPSTAGPSFLPRPAPLPLRLLAETAPWVSEPVPARPSEAVSPRPGEASEANPPPLLTAPAPDRDPRWSAEGWLLLRRGGAVSAAGGLAPATYGASQAGAVVRYRLATDSAHRPALHLRGSAALGGPREREAALGLSARPLAGVPLVIAAEARIIGQRAGTHLRPAAFVYTELPPLPLPLAARVEVYGQAGYVGGGYATAFLDGQVRLDRRVLRVGRGELRAGGGVWGGAQKHAARLDVGPTATIGMPVEGSGGARLGFDWRFRVAGNAAPSSGPALTLSAGF
ncbi:MAG: hypothetical protein WCY29_07770 [Novosphingobium sp.]